MAMIDNHDITHYITHYNILTHNHYITGWWFGIFFIFQYIGTNHPFIFFRGVETTNQLRL